MKRHPDVDYINLLKHNYIQKKKQQSPDFSGNPRTCRQGEHAPPENQPGRRPGVQSALSGLQDVPGRIVIGVLGMAALRADKNFNLRTPISSQRPHRWLVRAAGIRDRGILATRSSSLNHA